MSVTTAGRVGWERRPRHGAVALAALGVGSPLLAQLLLNRGITDRSAIAAYLDPPCPPAPDPGGLAGLDAALDRIERALDGRERIVIYGDYDVDGLSGSTLLQRALAALGGEVEVFIPHRDRDGYGLNSEAVGRLAEAGARLLITVDCGVTALPEIVAANDLGVDVVVTDHHTALPELPLAVAVVNPRRPDCPYPFKQLAGAGVALKVAQALLRHRLDPREIAWIEPSLFELAALGTVADVMPLIGDNRAIVRHGLAALSERPSPGLAALLGRAGVSREWIDAESISFKIAPRLNAAGRLDDAALAQRLLATTHPDEAAELADRLEYLNGRRRELSAEALDEARQDVLRLGSPLPPALVVTSPHPAGVLGLVAVKLMEETGCPVAVIERADGPSRASVRAPAGFDAIGAVTACADLLIRYGGHGGAAGFTLDSSLVETFRARFAEAAERALPIAAPDTTLAADCRLRPSTVDARLLDLTRRLGPFGAECPEPLFETSDLLVREARIVGDGHVRLRLFGEGRMLTGIMFRAADDVPPVGERIDVLYRARPNVWNGQLRVDLQVAGWRPSVG